MISKILKRAALAYALAGALLATPLYAQTAPPIESFTLSNGLEVIVIPNHRVPAVSHMLWFRVGSADDPPGKSGLAHFHEHMMYEGTIKYKAGEFAGIIANHGGEENAFTGRDSTAYYVNIAKDQLPLVMALEAERMRGLNPTGDGTAKEKQVIIEERRQRIENNPDALMDEQMSAALWRNHPYHVPVIGWMHEMEGLTKDDVLAFHQTWYHPNDAILIVSGDITAAELKPLAQKYYGNLPRALLPLRQWNSEPPQIAARRVILHHVNVEQPKWSRIYAASSLVYGKKEQALPLFVLAQVLGGGKASRLYKSLVAEKKLATEIDADYDGFTLGPSEFTLSITPEHGIDLGALEKATDEELERVKQGGISEEELKRAKILLAAESVYARDGLSEMARIMGTIRIAGLDKDYFTRWPQLIDAVTVEQVNQAARETLELRQSVTGLLLPEEGK